MTFLSNLLRFSALALIIIGFSFECQSSPKDSLTQMSQQLVDEKPDILYFSDTAHSNFRLLSIYTELVSQITKTAPEYNCVFLEADRQMFQPALDSFMRRERSWEDSVGTAQSAWEKITGRPYKQAPKPFLNRLRKLGLKVFAVDWSDESPESQNMKNLFAKGFAGDKASLEKAFDLGVNVRNSVMAQNMYQILNTKDESAQPLCGKAVMFTGGLHLAEDVVMPMGRQKYQSIASHPVLESYSQMAHEILDCNGLNFNSSEENINQCPQAKAFGGDSIIIENLFSPKDFFEVAFMISVSQTAGNQLSTFPKIRYNIMVLPED